MAAGWTGLANSDEQYVPDNSTDTSTGSGHDLDAHDFPGTPGRDDPVIEKYLYSQYWFARTRWRRFAGKEPRRQRFGNGFKGKGRPPRVGFGNQHYYGKGNQGGKGPRKNPRGKDGRIRTFDGCGPEDHFIKDCPQKQNRNRAYLATSLCGTGAAYMMTADADQSTSHRA